MQKINSFTQKQFYFFDCDGVLWHESQAIPGARELLIHINEQNKTTRFVTNSTVGFPHEYAEKIGKVLDLPFKIKAEQVITAAQVTVWRLKQSLPTGAAILLIGSKVLMKGIEEAGFCVDYVGDFNESSGKAYSAIVVGYDSSFSYETMTSAIRAVQGSPDCKLIGCNADSSYVGQGGKLYAGTGSLVHALAYATGLEAEIIGKPNGFIYSVLTASLPQAFDPAHAVFIGDRLDSDIAFAKAHGLVSILVETGVHRRKHVKDIIPDRIVANLLDLIE